MIHMAKTYRITPSDLVSAVHVSARFEWEEIENVICMGINATKLKHTLTFINGCFGLKHRIKIRYLSDTESARICEKAFGVCDGGTNKLEIGYPLPHQYFKGAEKQFVKFICWTPDIANPDFNLEISVTVTPYSQDLEDSVIEDSIESFDIVFYGKDG